jgi:hypothetical protein
VFEAFGGWRPGGAARRQLVVTDFKVNALGRHIDRNQIAGFDQREWTANKGLGRNVQAAGCRLQAP